MLPQGPVLAGIQREQAPLCFPIDSMIQNFRTRTMFFTRRASCVLRT
jgi:hypothetical protein